jgi:hypothetical protein
LKEYGNIIGKGSLIKKNCTTNWVPYFTSISTIEKRKTESLKKTQHDKIENFTGSVW